MKDRNHVKCTAPLQIVRTEGTKTTYGYIEAQSHSIVQWTGRFSCLIPVLCILCYRCRSLQSCRLYRSQCVDHLREYRGYHSRQLEIIHETVFEDYEQNPIILYEHNQERKNDCYAVGLTHIHVLTNSQAYIHIHRRISMQFKQPLLIPIIHFHLCYDKELHITRRWITTVNSWR